MCVCVFVACAFLWFICARALVGGCSPCRHARGARRRPVASLEWCVRVLACLCVIVCLRGLCARACARVCSFVQVAGVWVSYRLCGHVPATMRVCLWVWVCLCVGVSEMLAGCMCGEY